MELQDLIFCMKISQQEWIEKLRDGEAAQYRALGNAIPPIMFWYVTKNVLEKLS